MRHFIWQKNVDFMKPKELICRFLVEKLGGCLGVFWVGSIYGGFLKWWYPITMGFPAKHDHFGVFGGTTI